MASIRMGDDERVDPALLFVESGENVVSDCIFFSSRYRAGVNQYTSSVRANDERCVTLTHVNEMNLYVAGDRGCRRNAARPRLSDITFNAVGKPDVVPVRYSPVRSLPIGWDWLVAASRTVTCLVTRSEGTTVSARPEVTPLKTMSADTKNNANFAFICSSRPRDAAGDRMSPQQGGRGSLIVRRESRRRTVARSYSCSRKDRAFPSSRPERPRA